MIISFRGICNFLSFAKQPESYEILRKELHLNPYQFIVSSSCRIFKLTPLSVQENINLLHASVLSMVEFDDDIFAAGHCFDWNQYSTKKGLFCPFAHRLPPPEVASLAKDLASEYHYLGNTSEWFYIARKNAERVIAKNEQYIKGNSFFGLLHSVRAEVKCF